MTQPEMAQDVVIAVIPGRGMTLRTNDKTPAVEEVGRGKSICQYET
jgi:hypothetical protein